MEMIIDGKETQSLKFEVRNFDDESINQLQEKGKVDCGEIDLVVDEKGGSHSTKIPAKFVLKVREDDA